MTRFLLRSDVDLCLDARKIIVKTCIYKAISCEHGEPRIHKDRFCVNQS